MAAYRALEGTGCAPRHASQRPLAIRRSWLADPVPTVEMGETPICATDAHGCRGTKGSKDEPGPSRASLERDLEDGRGWNRSVAHVHRSHRERLHLLWDKSRWAGLTEGYSWRWISYDAHPDGIPDRSRLLNIHLSDIGPVVSVKGDGSGTLYQRRRSASGTYRVSGHEPIITVRPASSEIPLGSPLRTQLCTASLMPRVALVS